MKIQREQAVMGGNEGDQTPEGRETGFKTNKQGGIYM